MEVWQLLLYGTAGVLSLRTLAGLMTAQKQRLLDDYEAIVEQRQREEAARLQAEKEVAIQAAKKQAAAGGLYWPPAAKSDKSAA